MADTVILFLKARIELYNTMTSLCLWGLLWLKKKAYVYDKRFWIHSLEKLKIHSYFKLSQLVF